MALNIRSIYKSAGASLVEKQLVNQGMSPMQARQTAQAIIGGKQPPPPGIRIPQEELALPFGLSPMMLLVIGVVVIGGVGFYFMQRK